MFTLRQSEYSFLRKADILSLCKPVTTPYGKVEVQK